MAQELTPRGPELWTLEGDEVRMYGIPFPTRMTIARLPDGELWLHSPVALSAKRRAAVEALGKVAHLVAPNKVHSLGLAPWSGAFPEARVWVSPGFVGRHPEFAGAEVLENGAQESWAEHIESLHFDGSFFLDEVLFLSRPAKTLIVTDLVQRHVSGTDGFFWRVIKRMVRIWGERGGTALDLRMSFNDRDAAARCARKVLSWDFDKIILSHGLCVEQDAKAYLREAFSAWLRL